MHGSKTRWLISGIYTTLLSFISALPVSAQTVQPPAAKTFSLQQMYQFSGIQKFNLYNIGLFGILILFAVIAGLIIHHKCHVWLEKQVQYDTVSAAFVTTVKHYCLLLMILAASSFFFALLYINTPYTLSELSCYLLFSVALIFALTRFVVYPPPPASNLLGMKDNIARSLYIRVFLLGLFLLLGVALFLIFRSPLATVEQHELARIIYISALSITLMWVGWGICRLPQIDQHVTFSASIKAIITLISVLMVTAEWMGYHDLAIFLVFGGLLNLTIFALFFVLTRLIDIALGKLRRGKSKIGDKIRYYLGIKPHRELQELTIIKISLYSLLLGIATLLLMQAWQVNQASINFVARLLIQGVSWGEFTIAPAKLVTAALIFSFLNLFGRWVSAHTARLHRFEDEEGTQVAFASIISYISFAIALVIALVFAGIDFTGLAIIAGALSVGIGFGLRDIVNNFVSGIILLIEKPIKPGDRIVIGDTEGHIEKIRIRSTQIKTRAREDVIVPNSELITKQVKNYMFRDGLWRVTTEVGVAYGSDVSLVNELLLNIAKQHPKVIQQPPHQPNVLFRSFADSSLIFMLRVIIHDVNRKSYVKSDLNFAIEQAFREHHIDIAFPQQDIYIKEWPHRPKAFEN